MVFVRKWVDKETHVDSMVEYQFRTKKWAGMNGVELGCWDWIWTQQDIQNQSKKTVFHQHSGSNPPVIYHVNQKTRVSKIGQRIDFIQYTNQPQPANLPWLLPSQRAVLSLLTQPNQPPSLQTNQPCTIKTSTQARRDCEATGWAQVWLLCNGIEEYPLVFRADSERCRWS